MPNKLTEDISRFVNCSHQWLCFGFEPWARTKDHILDRMGYIGLWHQEFCSTLNVLIVFFLAFHLILFPLSDISF